jgi:integrase-like protein
VTQLRKKVLEELERRNYSQATAHAYVGAIRRFWKLHWRGPDQTVSFHKRHISGTCIESWLPNLYHRLGLASYPHSE